MKVGGSTLARGSIVFCSIIRFSCLFSTFNAELLPKECSVEMFRRGGKRLEQIADCSISRGSIRV